MEDADRILAPSIRQDPNLAATEDVAARMQDIDLSVLLVYIIDTAPESVLYSLAKQFNMTGYRGWLPAKTTEGRREMLKRAIEFKRALGTPDIIKQWIGIIGYDNVTILERPPSRLYDGTIVYSGSEYFSAIERSWRLLRVYIDLLTPVVAPGDGTLIRKVIEAYKPARSYLQHVGFRYNFFYDGSVNYDGSHAYGGEIAAT